MSVTAIQYPLLLMPKVKGQTKISSKNQVTIPVGTLREAGFKAGDVLRVEADGSGRVVLTSLDDLFARYSGALDTGGEFRKTVEALREEWR